MKKDPKFHRQKDAQHKRSSKSTHHKHKKEHPASESVLEPIQEVSKEKVKLDKNACGDYINLVLPPEVDNRKKKPKCRENVEKSDRIEKVVKDENNIFAKDYLQKLKESTDNKIIRHRSLEKTGDSLINRTKNIFRKEKSFNDAVQKISVNLETSKDQAKSAKKRRRSEKDEPIKEKNEKLKSHEKPSKKDEKDCTVEKADNKEKKSKKHKKKRTKSSEKSPISGKNMINRVQEVIYCQLDQVPYKLKNDKSHAEIKDLFQRIKRDKTSRKDGERICKHRSQSHEKRKKNHSVEKYMSYQSHILDNQKEMTKARSQSPSKRVNEELIEKVEEEPKLQRREHGSKDKHYRRSQHQQERLLEDSLKKSGVKKRINDSLNKIDLGPYHKYFAFEDRVNTDNHQKKYHKKEKEHRNIASGSREKKYRENQEKVIYNLEYDHILPKRHHEKDDANTEPIHKSRHKTDEEKIHQIVEGDLKTYFNKIQHMIDRKLDAILQLTKSKHEKTSNTKIKEKENRKRSKSRTKDKKSEKEERSGSKKEERSKKDDKHKPNDSKGKDENITKEEIVQEVLKRINKEVVKEQSFCQEKKRSKAKMEKEIGIENENKEVNDSMRKVDRKKSSKIHHDVSSDRPIDKSHSKSHDVACVKKSSCRRHPESVKCLKQKEPSSSHKPDKKYETSKQGQDTGDHKRKDPCRHKKKGELHSGSRDSRSPDNIYKTNHLKDPQDLLHSHRSVVEKHRSPEKTVLPKDSLTYMRNRGSPPPELVIPAADMNSTEWESHLGVKKRPRNPYTESLYRKEEKWSCHSLRKHYTSASSCRAHSDHYLVPSVDSRVTEQKSEQYITRPQGQRLVVSDEIRRERYQLDRQMTSSPERRCETADPTKHDYITYLKHDRVLSPREHLVARPEDYIIAPREASRKPELRIEGYVAHNRYHVNHSPVMHCSRHDIIVECTDPNVGNIILPPEMFRTPRGKLNDIRDQTHYQERLGSPERQHPRQEFVVQGIEPPILECSMQKSRRPMRSRNLECKTVSIVGIPPRIIVKDLPMTNQTQTSSKSQKSTIPDVELVEKRKHSKRFKLYYKYSVVNNSKEDKDSGTSDARSILSDSYRAVSNPSDEDIAMMCYAKDVRTTRDLHMVSEVSQALNTAQKKWNRMATSRDSHLNNIIEEPSSISNSIRNDEYFIPIRGANECYFRALTSSHSEYCFKINKKPANSNISVVSKDTRDGGFRNEDVRCRYCKHDRLKSDISLGSKCHGIQIFRSKSDVFLGGASGKKVIRSIFLEDSHPFVKSKRTRASPREKKVTRTCKNCQTSEVKVNYDFIPVDEENKLEFEDKQRQFKDIYKTIDDLEDNIYSSRRAPPKTLDVAVSSKFISLDKISDKKPQFKEIYKTIDNLQNRMIDTSHKESIKTVDVAIGSTIKIHPNQRSGRSEPRKNTHEIAVGGSKDQMRARTPGYKSESRGKRLKSTGVSPIRVVEEIQNSSKSPIRKVITPISPSPRPYSTRPSTQKPFANVRDGSPLKKTLPKVAETKKEFTPLRPKILVVKNTKIQKSPERTQPELEDRWNSKQENISQPGQAIKVLRSDERSASLKKRESIAQNRSRDRKEKGNKVTTEKNKIRENEEAVSRPPCIVVNLLEDDKPIITVPTNNTQISSKASIRKGTPNEKRDVFKKQPNRNPTEDSPKSCVHHYHSKELNAKKSSKTTAFQGKSPIGTAKTPVTVNAALVKYGPAIQKKVILSEGSTSSSLSDNSTQNRRKSKSLMEVQTEKKYVSRSKSEIINAGKELMICTSRSLNTNGGSVVSGNMEKFANVPKLRCQSSKSNVHSLDHFIGHKFTSRLLLTKDYKGGEISSYQRRKLYDQSIRQKMKRKFRFSKLNVGPQIFEVRFLSMVSQESVQRKEKETRVKKHLERPLISINLDKVKTEGSIYQKGACTLIMDKGEGEHVRADNSDIDKISSSISKKDNFVELEKSDYCIVTENYPKKASIFQSVADIQKGNDACNEDVIIKFKNMNVKVEDKSVTELYFKDQKINQDKLLSFCNKLLEVNSSLEFPEGFKGAQCACSKYSANCQSCKNFVNLMDILCSSVASYCSESKTKLINLKFDDDFMFNNFEKNDESVHNNKDNVKSDYHGATEESKNLYLHLDNFETHESSNIVKEIFSRSGNNFSGESFDQNDKVFKNLLECVSPATTSRTDNTPVLSQPLSCPVLPTNTSSFEFLYEETSSTENEGISRETVLANLTRPFDPTFNFSMSQYNVETPFYRGNSYFSGTGSSESGYASIKSKSCKENSVINFFKKPNIVSLLNPPVLSRKKCELRKVCGQKSQGDFRESVLYRNMTKSCQLYAKKVKETSEMKLTEVDEYKEFSLALLLGKDSSIVLESTALRKHSSTHVDLTPYKNIEFNTGKITDSKTNDEISNAGDIEDDFSKNNEPNFSENGCKLVLTNQCLGIDSFTYLGPEIFNEECLNVKNIPTESQINDFVDDTRKKNDDNTSLKDEDSSFTLDFSLDSNNPFVPSKDLITRKFFGSLLKVYEKEMEICSELFKNDEFLKTVLLPAVKERNSSKKRSKKGTFGNFFRKKVRDNHVNSEGNKSEYMSNIPVKALAKLKNLASNAKKCFTMLAEAVKLNENIDDEIKICGLLKLLERIETGDFHMIKNDGALNIEQDVKSQIKEAFVNIYEICEKEAKKVKRNIGDREISLIKGFVSKYRIGLISKTDIVACYIGRDVIKTETQLKAAVTYLMRSQSNEVNVKEFEEYCNFTKSFQK